MITSVEIKEYASNYAKICESEDYKKLKKDEAKLNRKLEKDLLTSKSFVNFTQEEANNFYESIDSEKYISQNDTSIIPYKLQELSLMGSNKIYLSSIPGSLENNEKIIEWFRNFRFLCIEHKTYKEFSEYIHKFKSYIFEKDGFIIKTPKIDLEENIPEEKLDSLVHEAFIGIYALNSLRKKGIPNFAYIYSAYDTSYPLYNAVEKKIYSHQKDNDTSNQVFCFLYEDISYSHTLFDACKNSNFEVILGFYLQILFALKSASNYFDYAHYDLHSKNVLIRNIVNDYFDIEYDIEDGKKVWIRSQSGSVATIVDYSTSYIALKADEKITNFGYNNYDEVPFEQVGIYTNKGFVISDAYKLLLHILICTYLSNRPAFDKLKIILSFFTNESPENCIINQKETFFHLPYHNKTKDLKLLDFIKFILKKFENSSIIQYKSNGKNLKCIGNSLEANPHFYKNNLYYIPSSMIQLYDFIKYYANMYNESKDQRYISIINQTALSFEKEYRHEVSRVEKIRLTSLNNILNNRFILYEVSYNVNILKCESFKNSIFKHIERCLYYVNSWERLKTGIKILEFIEKGGEMFKTYYTEYNELFNKNKKFYEGVRQNLLKFYVFFSYGLEQHSNIPLPGLTKEIHYEIVKDLRKIKDLEWYFLMSHTIKNCLTM
jgi:hypothetical protein